MTKKNNVNEITANAQKICGNIVAMIPNGGYAMKGETALRVRLHYIESLLGTAPMDKEIYRTWIAKNALDAKSMEEKIEMMGVEGVFEKGLTGFPRTKDGKIGTMDYTLRGYLKETVTHEKRGDNSVCKKFTAHKTKIDGAVFVRPRFVPINLTGNITILQRPLRAQTAQGDRVAIAASEEVPAGSTQEFIIAMKNKEFDPYIRACLDYGIDHGNGQWRNSGHGRFLWEELDLYTGEQIGGNYTPEFFELLYNDANCLASDEELSVLWTIPYTQVG